MISQQHCCRAASQYQTDAETKLAASRLRVRSVMRCTFYAVLLHSPVARKYCLRSNRWTFIVHSSDCVASPPRIVMVLFTKLFIPVINSVVISSVQFPISLHLVITTVDWVPLWKANHIRTLFYSGYGDKGKFLVLFCIDRIPCHENHCSASFYISITLDEYSRNPLF